jgi:outer membrane receptor for ferrienterochelin and colicin
MMTDRLVIEAGLRLDRDAIIRRELVAPRLSASYLLTPHGTTRIAAGIGVYYDATSLDFITRPLAGRRWDFFYDPTGVAPHGLPIRTSFQIHAPSLRAPRFLNWSIGLEHQLPAAVHLRLEVIGKRGREGFAFAPQEEAQATQLQRYIELRNVQRDRYQAVSFTLRRAFKDNHEFSVNYTRSSARSNAVLDFSLDNVLFSPQAGGPLAWDAPNRLLSWGWLPFIKKFNLAYALDWRTGYPFNLVNQEQRLVGAPNTRRFPDYFSLNLHAERRFELMGIHWAVRAGFNNLTNRQNPTEVNNNIDSPQFLAFGGAQGRSFVGRIRFLGRK